MGGCLGCAGLLTRVHACMVTGCAPNHAGVCANRLGRNCGAGNVKRMTKVDKSDNSNAVLRACLLVCLSSIFLRLILVIFVIIPIVGLGDCNEHPDPRGRPDTLCAQRDGRASVPPAGTKDNASGRQTPQCKRPWHDDVLGVHVADIVWAAGALVCQWTRQAV